MLFQGLHPLFVFYVYLVVYNEAEADLSLIRNYDSQICRGLLPENIF